MGKVDGNGQQTSFKQPQGIYFDPSSKKLIIADNKFYSIRKMNQSGTLVDRSSISSKNQQKQINKILPKNNLKGYVSTIAGNGIQGTNNGQGTFAQFYFPYCVTMDSIGNIYVGDYCAIRMINSTGLN